MSDEFSSQINGVKSAPRTSIKDTPSTSKQPLTLKANCLKKKSIQHTFKAENNCKLSSRASTKKLKNKNKCNNKRKDVAAVVSSSSPTNTKKIKHESYTQRNSYYSGSDDDSIKERRKLKNECSRAPEIGEEVAIKCPPDPPYPEGWYSGIVVDVIHHVQQCYNVSNKKNGSSKVKSMDFTLQIEWDGGGVEELRNPEWRMKGDEPDKQGRISHRDAKLRPYFKYWVNRLNSITESEKKLSRTRAGKHMRIDTGQKVEWIQCSNSNCGKWRALPPYLKACSILETCDSTWYCVLNTWDEAVASCSAPQETGYMRVNGDL